MSEKKKKIIFFLLLCFVFSCSKAQLKNVEYKSICNGCETIGFSRCQLHVMSDSTFTLHDNDNMRIFLFEVKKDSLVLRKTLITDFCYIATSTYNNKEKVLTTTFTNRDSTGYNSVIYFFDNQLNPFDTLKLTTGVFNTYSISKDTLIYVDEFLNRAVLYADNKELYHTDIQHAYTNAFSLQELPRKLSKAFKKEMKRNVFSLNGHNFIVSNNTNDIVLFRKYLVQASMYSTLDKIYYNKKKFATTAQHELDIIGRCVKRDEQSVVLLSDETFGLIYKFNTDRNLTEKIYDMLGHYVMDVTYIKGYLILLYDEKESHKSKIGYLRFK